MKRMGLDCGLDKGISTPEQVNKAKGLVPKALQPYISCKLLIVFLYMWTY